MFRWTANYISRILAQRPQSHYLPDDITLVYTLNNISPGQPFPSSEDVNFPSGHSFEFLGDTPKETDERVNSLEAGDLAAPNTSQLLRIASAAALHLSLSFNKSLQTEGPAVNPHRNVNCHLQLSVERKVKSTSSHIVFCTMNPNCGKGTCISENSKGHFLAPPSNAITLLC